MMQPGWYSGPTIHVELIIMHKTEVWIVTLTDKGLDLYIVWKQRLDPFKCHLTLESSFVILVIDTELVIIPGGITA
jgi:hypothetical protein